MSGFELYAALAAACAAACLIAAYALRRMKLSAGRDEAEPGSGRAAHALVTFVQIAGLLGAAGFALAASDVAPRGEWPALGLGAGFGALILVASRVRSPGPSASWLLLLTELLFAVAAGWWLYDVTRYGSTSQGNHQIAYLAFAAFGLLALAQTLVTKWNDEEALEETFGAGDTSGYLQRRRALPARFYALFGTVAYALLVALFFYMALSRGAPPGVAP